VLYFFMGDSFLSAAIRRSKTPARPDCLDWVHGSRFMKYSLCCTYLDMRGAEISFFPQPLLARYLLYNSIFDWTVSVTRNDFLVSSESYVGILI